jgi:hypothetical protein
MCSLIRILPLVGLLPLAACLDDDRRPAAAEPTDPVAIGADIIQPIVEQLGAPASDGTVRYRIRIPRGQLGVAAYSGTVQLDLDRVEVIDIAIPEAGDDEARVLNRSELTHGRLRFAAFAAEKFTTDELLTMTVRTRGAGADAPLVVALDVVGDQAGKAAPMSQLRMSQGVIEVQPVAVPIDR